MRCNDSSWCRHAGSALRAAVLVVALGATALLSSGCGDNGGAYVGAWLESGEQASALRITDATDRVLVDYLDLTRPADDQTLFSTEATVQDDRLRLRYEYLEGQVVSGGTLQLTGDGATLVWTDSSGKRLEFNQVTVLPTAAP